MRAFVNAIVARNQPNKKGDSKEIGRGDTYGQIQLTIIFKGANLDDCILERWIQAAFDGPSEKKVSVNLLAFGMKTTAKGPVAWAGHPSFFASCRINSRDPRHWGDVNHARWRICRGAFAKKAFYSRLRLSVRSHTDIEAILTHPTVTVRCQLLPFVFFLFFVFLVLAKHGLYWQ
jgi:hypothetical protein